MNLMTQKEACAWLKVSRSTLMRLREYSGLPAVLVGKRYRYDEEALSLWLKQQSSVAMNEEQPVTDESGATIGDKHHGQ